jgi:hypothetical protein
VDTGRESFEVDNPFTGTLVLGVPSVSRGASDDDSSLHATSADRMPAIDNRIFDFFTSTFFPESCLLAAKADGATTGQ